MSSSSRPYHPWQSDTPMRWGCTGHLGTGVLQEQWGHARLWILCTKLGLGKVLRGQLSTRGGGGEERGSGEARQAPNARAAEALGRDIPGHWETAAA